MRKSLLLLILLASCSTPQPPHQAAIPPVEANRSQRVKPDYSWKSDLFKSINERARMAKLPALQTTALANADIEVRVWHGFGLIVPEAVILNRSAGQWSAMHLDAIPPKLPANKYLISLSPPKSGWDICWQKFVDAGLLVLPDASELGKEPGDPDVMSYVVELKVGGDYRTYHYTYPEANDHNEAKQMMQIGEVISEEFGLPDFRTHP